MPEQDNGPLTSGQGLKGPQQSVAGGDGADLVGDHGVVGEMRGRALPPEAAWSGQVEALQLLLTRGADPNHSDTRYASTPLGWAQHRHEELGASGAHEQVERILTTAASRWTKESWRAQDATEPTSDPLP